MDQKLDFTSEELANRVALLERKLAREKKARKEAEKILEEKSRALFETNKDLQKLNTKLENYIVQRNNILNSIVKSLNQGILVEDADRKIIMTNNYFKKIFNIQMKEEDLIGLDCGKAAESVSHLFEDPEYFAFSSKSNFEAMIPIFGEIFKLKDGTVLERDSIPILYGDNKRQGYLWQYKDVTEEYNFQKRITDSEEKYRGIIENMELGLLEVDKNHNIKKAYPSFCEMTGYREEELIGENAREKFLPDEYKELMDTQERMRNQGSPGIYEVQLKKKSGEHIWVLISGAPFYNSKGEITGSIGIHYDITHRKILEQELEEARDQAERAREAEKQFLANMSHEIRNPINSIIGITNLLYDTKPSEEQVEYFNGIKYSADILLGLISGILDISKIESGNFELSERDIDLNEMLSALIDMVSFKAEGKPVDFDVQLDSNINFPVKADPTAINQIFLNLLSNALKFTDKGNITVNGQLKEERDNNVCVEFNVIDTGIGMSEEELKIVFDSFRQGSKDINLKYGGTGLGLAIVKKLIEMYNGQISVTSKPQEGSVFTFFMYFKKGIRLDKTETKEEISSHEFKRVLIVEDNPINQKYLAGILKKWKVETDLASDGKEALEVLKANSYDLILMDIRMPNMDGYETTIRLRSSSTNANSNVPIVALTASALVDEKERALAAGMNYHMTKPFTPDQLANVLKNFDIVYPKSSVKNVKFKFNSDLNTNYLEELYQEDIERAGMMFDLFLKVIDSEFEKLEKYMVQKDWKAFASQAHKIKPNFSMVGLTDLSDNMKKFEDARKYAEVREYVEKSFETVKEIFADGKKIISSECKRIQEYI